MVPYDCMVVTVIQNASGTSTKDRRTEIADAVLLIAATRGLDHASVREVAAECGCAIGTVQHHFRTKDEMLEFAFRRVVDRTRERALQIDQDHGVRPALREILGQLLPLDKARSAECAVHLAFAGRATVVPQLAKVQAETLAEVRAELAYLLGVAREEAGLPRGDVDHDALGLLALLDGLALHAVSAPGQLTPDDLTQALDRHLEALLDGRAPASA